MFYPFPVDKAFEVCKRIISQIIEGKITVAQNSKISRERENQGVMLGVLVCRDKNGTEINLQTLSGIGKELLYSETDEKNIFVKPVVSSEEINNALSENDKKIHELTDRINSFSEQKKKSEAAVALKQERNKLCNESLEKVYSLYNFMCADKVKRSLKEICEIRNNSRLPPTGTGDCCEPKLFNYAYTNDLIPESLCQVYLSNEILYGKENLQEIKIVPPCDERCGIILPEILGLKILYRDEHIIVVDKQSGVLSVPGRGPEKQDCIVNRVRKLFPECIEQPSVHRLDMETSGLLVLAFTKEAHRNLCRQFEEGSVQKTYIAVLDGILAKKGIAAEGQMELYFRLDVDNRPHQIWDEVYGKKAVTQWKILNVEKYSGTKINPQPARSVTRVLFTPHTGRTHQLRLASADSHGFGVSIVGDTLYGHCEKGERLLLHAQTLSFIHPFSGERMNFECPAPF